MSDTHFVARTAEGLPHGNTLALHRLWTVIVHIDAPAGSQNGQGQGDQPDGSQAQSQAGRPNDGQAPTQDSQASGGKAEPPQVAGQGRNRDSQGDPGAAQAGQGAQDSWRLVNDDGIYDRTLQRSEAVRIDDKLLCVRFTDVIPEGTYSLYHCLLSGAALPVFLSVPFAALEDHGEETPEPSKETWTLPALGPEPAPLSDDPLLLHDPVDHMLDSAWYSDFAWYGSDALPEDSQDDSQPDPQTEDSTGASDPPQEDSAGA